MRPSLTSQVNHWLRVTVPGLMALALLLIGVLPLGLPDFGPIAPVLTLPAVYYWSIYRPDLMPAPLAFALGLLHDILNGGPPGLMALVLLLVQGACVSQSKVVVGKSFVVGWFGFLLIAAGAHIAAWLLACIYYFQALAFWPVLMQFVVTMLLYPFIARLFSLTQAWIARVEIE